MTSFVALKCDISLRIYVKEINAIEGGHLLKQAKKKATVIYILQAM